MAPNKPVFLFGEAEKGEFCKPVRCTSLLQLLSSLGEAPRESSGIAYAIQFLASNLEVFFFRIEEEGFSLGDYLQGFRIVQEAPIHPLAVCLPGVGDPAIIEAITPICQAQKSLLILSEHDLYDYLTSAL